MDKVEIHPSGQCQLRCPFCYGLDLAPQHRTNLPVGIIETNILRDLREAPELKDEEPLIVFAGMYGEPLLYPDIRRAISIVGELQFRFGIYTNGLSLDDDLCHILVTSANKCKKTLKPIYISFNITASVITDRLYEDLLPKIEKLSKIRNKENSSLQINAPIGIVKECCRDAVLRPMQDKLLDMGVDNIRYSFPWAPLDSSAIQDYQFIETEEYRDTLAIIKQLERSDPKRVKKRMPNIRPFDHCFAMSMSIAISPEGDVFPCPEVCSPIFKNKGLSFGSIINQRLSQIWQSRKHMQTFQSFDPRTIKCVCCPVDFDFNTTCAQIWPPSFEDFGKRLLGK
ncbi:MAG: SPASM domain-containing protein [Nitrospirae bacterium]|nr:SPASM domain-containing protein [Nitrospirota bacterium]